MNKKIFILIPAFSLVFLLGGQKVSAQQPQICCPDGYGTNRCIPFFTDTSKTCCKWQSDLLSGALFSYDTKDKTADYCTEAQQTQPAPAQQAGQEYKLTVKIEGAIGAVSGDSASVAGFQCNSVTNSNGCTWEATSPEEIQLTAITVPGTSKFQNWVFKKNPINPFFTASCKKGNNSPVCTFIMERNTEVSAVFSRETAGAAPAAPVPAQPAPAAKQSGPIVETQTTAQIFGSHEGKMWLVNTAKDPRYLTEQGEYRITIAGLVTLKDTNMGQGFDFSKSCLILPVKLTLYKNDSKDPFKVVDTVSCKSEIVVIAKKGESPAGEYTLTAVSPGDSGAKGSSDAVKIEINGRDDPEVEVTTTTIKVPGVRGISKQATKINLFDLFMGNANKVAGISMVQQGTKTLLITDPNNPATNFSLLPETVIANQSCNPDDIPVINFTIYKVLKNSVSEVIFNDPAYPNCQAKKISLSDLGDLGQIDRLEASASYPDNITSPYLSSQGSLTITVADTGISAKPFVKLSTDPETVKSFDNSVNVIATTNTPVSNPVFEITQNNQTSSIPPTFSNSGCSNGGGVCMYRLLIAPPNGDYQVTFRNGEISDTVSFSAKPESLGDNTIIKLLVNGKEFLFPEGTTDLPLENLDVGENSILLYINDNLIGSGTIIYDPNWGSNDQSISKKECPKEYGECQGDHKINVEPVCDNEGNIIDYKKRDDTPPDTSCGWKAPPTQGEPTDCDKAGLQEGWNHQETGNCAGCNPGQGEDHVRYCENGNITIDRGECRDGYPGCSSEPQSNCPPDDNTTKCENGTIYWWTPSYWSPACTWVVDEEETNKAHEEGRCKL